MKEIMAIVRQNKTALTKKTLLDAGFPAFTCRKVQGRGKNPLNYNKGEDPKKAMLLPKRLFSFIVNDNDVETVIEAFKEINSQGKAGDGKIFVLPIQETYRIRNGERGSSTI